MNVKKILSYLAIYLIWGSTYFAIRMAVQTIPAFAIVGLRFVCGGAALLAFVLLFKKSRENVTPRAVLASMGIGFLLLIGGNGCVTIAVRKVDSYIAALIVTSIPLLVLIFDRVLFKKPVQVHAFAAIIMGFIGIGMLLNTGKGIVPDISGHALFVLLGSSLWALGTSLSKHTPQPNDPFMNSAIQLVSSGIVALLMIPLVTPVSKIHPSTCTSSSLVALAYLVVFGTLALVAYGYLLKTEPNNRVVTYAFVNPPIALFLGLVFGGETPAPFLVPALALICGALALTFYGHRLTGLMR